MPLDVPMHERLEHPIRKLVRLPRAGISVLRETPMILHRASRLYGLSPAATLRRFRQLYKRRFTAQYAFLLGLFDPAVTEREIDSCISNHALHSLQELVNPRAWEQMTEDKAVFYRYCDSVALPIPSLYAIHFRSTGGWAADNRRLEESADWDSFLLSIPSGEFVVKPAWGSYGRGVLILRKAEAGWNDHTGGRWTTARLIEALENDPSCDHFIIQERLRSHPDIHRLSPSPGLQTLRVITYVDRAGRVHLLFAALKLIAGETIVDNFASGANGNLYGEVDIDTGRLKTVVMMDPARGVLVEVSKHPATDLNLRGFRVPQWDETRNLATRAATAFLPVRAIGWDIAPSADGPRLIEGNMWFDAPLTRGGSGEPVPFDLISRDTLDRN